MQSKATTTDKKIDWLFLRGSLLWLVIAVVSALALYFLGSKYEEVSHESYRQGEANLRTVHHLYENIVKDIGLLEEYTTQFEDYKATGLVGAERRLSWIESLESTNSVLRLPKLTYNFKPQEDFVRTGLKVGRNVVLNSSPMELKMSLMHEEDLFALIDGLSQSVSNLFTIDSCNMKLLKSVGESLETKRANLSADCVVRWISIDVKA